MNKMVAVARLHFVNPWIVLIVPAIVLATIALATLVIWWLVLSAIPTEVGRADARAGFAYSGGTFYLFVYMMVVAVQAINVTFAFALGYGVTRRDYYLGSLGAFTLLSAFWATVLTLLASLEDLTDGWGLGGRIFSAVYFGDGQWYQRLFLYFVLLVAFFIVGAAVAAVYVRWKANGLVTFFVLVTALLVGGLAVVIRTSSWETIGAWFINTGVYGVAAWLLLPAALAGVAGYFVLLRATPVDSA